MPCSAQSIAGRIREARGDLSQEEFARRLGTTRGRVIAWEAGRNQPRLEALFRICTLAGITPAEFFTGLDFTALKRAENDARRSGA